MTPLGEKVDVLHVGTCVMNHCEYRDGLLESVQRKAGVPVVMGTHDYVPDAVFAG
jgi:predicted metal-binding protein